MSIKANVIVFFCNFGPEFVLDLFKPGKRPLSKNCKKPKKVSKIDFLATRNDLDRNAEKFQLNTH